MEEEIIREGEAAYFKSATEMYNGRLVLTNKRLVFAGEHARIDMDHGLLGNIIKEKVEKAMGYDNPKKDVIEIPINNISHELKRFGLTKRLIFRDGDDKVYKIQLFNRKEQPDWQEAIDKAKKNFVL